VSDTPRRFKLIEGGGKPKRYRAPKPGRMELLTCHVCEQDTGVSSTMTMAVKMGVFLKDGAPVGGTKAIICAVCLARGKTTILI
jgi:hypothetical protein